MSVRTGMHFMTRAGDPLPQIEITQHPNLPVILLTLRLDHQEFTWSDTAERMRHLFTAILAEPLLVPGKRAGGVTLCDAQTLVWVEADKRHHPYSCAKHPGHEGDHENGTVRWPRGAPPTPRSDK